jgi:hypothetical protein
MNRHVLELITHEVIYTFEKYKRNRKMVLSVMKKLTTEWGSQCAA